MTRVPVMDPVQIENQRNGTENGQNNTGLGWQATDFPVDLPSNIPDQEKYPFARYGGLHDFVGLMHPNDGWDFIVRIGGKRNETPTARFWTGAFKTSVMLEAYFTLSSKNRLHFVQVVVWIRDPLPGRPGGVQIVPPEWPPNLPTPVHHVMTRYAGLDRWVERLEDSWAEVARMALFGIHERFDPIWWLDYHKTVDVYNLYSRITPAMREVFVEQVYWIPDSTKGVALEALRCADKTSNGARGFSDQATASGADGGKFCYLSLFRDEHHLSVKSELGSNPWAAGVAAKLLKEPGIWRPGNYTLSVGRRVTDDGQAYLQGHVQQAKDGVPIVHLLSHFHGQLRLGATSDINALANLQHQDPITVVPTLFPTRAARNAPSLEMVYNIYATLNMTSEQMRFLTWVIMDHPSFTWLLGAFESVTLDKASFTVQISTGAQNLLRCAICAPDRAISSTSDWYTTPVNNEIHGSDQGYVSGVFALPDIHPFEREIRSPDGIGNPTPSFRFALGGAATAKAVIKGAVTLRIRGQYAMGHIDIGPEAPKKTALRMRQMLVDSLPYDTEGTTSMDNAAEEESDDDDEEQAAAPATANSSARRTS